MYVYFIRSGSRYVKVGKSNNPLSRMRSLQTASPTKLELLGAVRCNNEGDSFRVERELQSFFAQQLPEKEGEWFSFEWSAMKWLNRYLVANNARYPDCFNGEAGDPRIQALELVDTASMQINKWVRIKKLCEITGETDDGARYNMTSGMWPEDLLWRKAPNGRIYINVENYNRWVEGRPLLVASDKPTDANDE
jgi:hypothetical protein